MNVVRQSQERCSYKCPYYQDGPVISLCNKHKKQLRYDGNIPPLLTEECKAEMVPHNDRVEGRDAASSRRVPSHDGLCGNGTEVGSGGTAKG